MRDDEGNDVSTNEREQRALFDEHMENIARIRDSGLPPDVVDVAVQDAHRKFHADVRAMVDRQRKADGSSMHSLHAAR